ncbi:hypothetical protein CAEBREN_14889 [Caenorhabditis brenneri]|uniref:glucuronosyltransferase n=1 Tax=Caenorhabditis brenneri TaxID=135651 RepID=G0NSR6_CAEBE|nr:hypothetical protein CAEBREN_14889 [Caenorhabditis brenneri]
MYLLTLFCSIVTSNYAYNILVYSPSFGGSHTNFMARIADTLTDAGHNVTFLVPVVDSARKFQLGVKITKDVVMVDHEKHDGSFVDKGAGKYWAAEINAGNIKEVFGEFTVAQSHTCHDFLQRKDIFEEMKSRKFDVGIYEPLTVCGLGFMHAIGIRKIITASSEVFYDTVLDVIGEPLDLSHVPTVLSKLEDPEKWSFWDKIQNYKLSMAYQKWTCEVFDAQTAIYKKYLGEEVPDWRELIVKSSLQFVNSIPYVDFPRTVGQKTISIGGIQVESQTEDLEEIWDAVLSERPLNVLISFGSVVRSMDLPEVWRSNLLAAIKSQPNTTFIWKYESDDISFAAGVPNIHFSKWVPQTSLLNDPRLTAFITHGGLGSTNELSYHGVPAIMVPVFVDQHRNSNMLSRHGGVIVFKKQDLGDADKIKNALRAILYEVKYKKNSMKLAELLNNQPLKPREQVVRYVEFVARFGPFAGIDMVGRGLGLLEKNVLDIYFVLVAPYLLSLGLIFVVSFVMLLRVRSVKIQ